MAWNRQQSKEVHTPRLKVTVFHFKIAELFRDLFLVVSEILPFEGAASIVSTFAASLFA